MALNFRGASIGYRMHYMWLTLIQIWYQYLNFVDMGSQFDSARELGGAIVLNASNRLTGQNGDGVCHIKGHLVTNDEVTAESSNDSDSDDGDNGGDYQPARASFAM